MFEVFLPQLLLYPNPTDPLNGEAAALLMREPQAYAQKVKGAPQQGWAGLPPPRAFPDAPPPRPCARRVMGSGDGERLPPGRQQRAACRAVSCALTPACAMVSPLFRACADYVQRYALSDHLHSRNGGHEAGKSSGEEDGMAEGSEGGFLSSSSEEEDDVDLDDS